MKISEKQLQFLLGVLRDRISINIVGQSNPFLNTTEQSIKIYEEIINQQSEELKEVE